jgi:hypothetical protein
MPNYSGVWTLSQQAQAKAANNWPAPPDAPTIGTATATSSTTATVAFTAPANLGNPAIVTYTATSSPSGLTGTGTSPITVSGLTAATSYTFTVTATNASGTGPASAASNSITTLYTIGQALGGGYYAGQIGVSGVATHNLVVGPVSSAQNTSIAYKNASTATSGADSVIDGPQNTADMVADGSSTVYPAAHFCNDLVIGGYSDWYMPAKNELEVCYYNLKPTTTNNQESSGVNANAIPPRASPYTLSTPAQTSATNFRDTGAEDFIATPYWTSTESNALGAWRQRFNTGLQDYDYKSSSTYVRAIRRVAV